MLLALGKAWKNKLLGKSPSILVFNFKGFPPVIFEDHMATTKRRDNVMLRFVKNVVPSNFDIV